MKSVGLTAVLVLIVSAAQLHGWSAARVTRSVTQAQVTQPQGIRYEDFPAGKAFAGKPAAVKLITKKARMNRTVLREGAAGGPNFGGHYTVVTWGCGSSCVQFAIVDAISGNVYFPSFYVAVGVGSDQDYEHIPEPLQYKLDSKLLMVTGNLNEAEKGGVYYYKWDNSRLTLIKQSELPKQ